ncbi:hypothetical protein D3C87_1950620 [compost metagenome]
MVAHHRAFDHDQRFPICPEGAMRGVAELFAEVTDNLLPADQLQSEGVVLQVQFGH